MAPKRASSSTGKPSSYAYKQDEDFSTRLSEVVDSLGSWAAAGEAGDVAAEQVKRWVDRAANPNFFSLANICNRAGFSLDWLLTGAGSKYVGGSRGAGDDQAGLPLSEFTLVPRLDVRPSSGPGALVESEEASEMLAFRSEWLRRMGINPRAAHVLTNRGDSNEPTIRDGDVLLVDTSIDRVVDNAFYVVVFSGRTLLKRIQLRRDGSIVLSSDNRAVYQDEVVPEAEVPQLVVAGRLMWFGRSI